MLLIELRESDWRSERESTRDALYESTSEVRWREFEPAGGTVANCALETVPGVCSGLSVYDRLESEGQASDGC